MDTILNAIKINPILREQFLKVLKLASKSDCTYMCGLEMIVLKDKIYEQTGIKLGKTNE